MEAAGAGPSSSEGEHVRVYDIQACFAAHGGGSIDELSGRTTGRLGYIRPTTAHAIGGTAELALRYSYHLHLPPGRAASRSDYGPDGAAGVWSNAVVSAGAAGPFRDYGPDRSRRRRRRRRRRSTFQGLRAGWSGGRTKPEYPATSGRHDHATFRGAGQRVSPMYGTRSQQHVRRGTGRVTYRFMR